MVFLVTTPTIAAALHELSPSARAELNLSDPPPQVGAPISHDEVVSLARAFRRSADEDSKSDSNGNENQNEHEGRNGNRNGNQYTLNELLRGSDVYTPSPPAKPEPTPEYIALKKHLQSLAEEQAYNRLLAPAPRKDQYQPSPIFSAPTVEQAEAAADKDPLSPSLVLNIFMSVILCGFATFWALRNFQTPAFLRLKSRDLPVAGSAAVSSAVEPVFVLVSIFVGLLVGVAEVVVYAAYLRKVEQAREKEKRVKERKEVIRQDQDDGNRDGNHGEHDQTEEVKEEIWGKGINGGVRRRVRERWEKT